MANIVQLKRSSVSGRIPDPANVSIGEPVVNLADKVLYTKNGSGDIIQIAAGNLQGLADVSNATPNVNDVISWTGTEWAPRIVTEGGGGSGNVDSVNGQTGAVVLTTANIAESGNLYFTNARAIGAFTPGENIEIAANGRITATVAGGGGTTYSNILIGELQSKEFTANGNQDSFDIDFYVDDANSIIVFVDSVLQAPVVNYTVSNDILTFTSTPEANATVSVRYFDGGNVYQTRYFIGVQSNETFTADGTGNVFVLSSPLLSSEEALVFVNGVIQEPNVNYNVTSDVLTLTGIPSANSKIFVRTFSPGNEVDLGNLTVDLNATPTVGQALVWNGNAYGPGNVATEATVTSLSLYSRFDFTASNAQTVFTGADDNGQVLNINNGYAEVFLNGIRLVPNVDYTANATHVTLSEGADLNDSLGVINFVDGIPNFAVDTFTGNGSTTTFSLSRRPSNEASILVSFDGVKQFASEYTVSGTNLVFDTAPDSGTNIEVVFLGAAQSSTADNSWVELNSGLVAKTGTKYMANTVGGSFTITLPPTPKIGDSIVVLDGTSSFNTSNVLIDRNGKKIMGQNENLYLDVADSYTELVYYNLTYGWRVIS